MLCIIFIIIDRGVCILVHEPFYSTRRFMNNPSISLTNILNFRYFGHQVYFSTLNI